jgi:Tol biopolymer transport system component
MRRAVKQALNIIVPIVVALTSCTPLIEGPSPQAGSDLVFSSPDERIVGDLTWAPTGKELAFTVFDPWAGNNEIYIMDLSTGNVRTLIDQDGIEVQSWSPDGGNIVYNLYREIWLIRADGSMAPELLGAGQVAAWSPNSKQMAIFENVGTASSSIYILKILDLETGMEKIVFSTSIGNQEIFDLSWSPDNARLAFSLPPEKPDNGNNQRNIYMYNLETEELSPFTRSGDNYLPAWSPNGKQIAYLHKSSRTGLSSIIISQADDSCKVTVPGINDVGDLAWSPEGSYLAYTQHTSIYLLDLALIFGEDFKTVGPKCP